MTAEVTADLRRRIDRTLDYTDSLLRLPDLNGDLATVLRAVHNSLCTPADGGPQATCLEPSCDGELHFTGAKDPVTNEDVEAGPCPEWS
jgi:hypothetical protein